MEQSRRDEIIHSVISEADYGRPTTYICNGFIADFSRSIIEGNHHYRFLNIDCSQVQSNHDTWIVGIDVKAMYDPDMIFWISSEDYSQYFPIRTMEGGLCTFNSLVTDYGTHIRLDTITIEC